MTVGHKGQIDLLSSIISSKFGTTLEVTACEIFSHLVKGGIAVKKMEGAEDRDYGVGIDASLCQEHRVQRLFG